MPDLDDDDAIRAHTATLNDEQLDEFYAHANAAEINPPTTEPELKASALWYATSLNWPVFPVMPRGKQPLTRHGFKDASTDPDKVASWWMRWPDANIGVPTGADGCGYDVIDVDGPTGYASLAALKHSHCPPDCTAATFCGATGDLPPVHASALTPGDPSRGRGPGAHYFITASGDGNTTSLDPGIDYRGQGGYVLIAPSIGPSGARYSWSRRPTPAMRRP